MGVVVVVVMRVMDVGGVRGKGLGGWGFPRVWRLLGRT